MRTSSEEFQQLVERVDPQSKLIRAWELKGGVSAQVTALEVKRPGGETKKMIVRCPSGGHPERNSKAAAYEFNLLRMARSLGLNSPSPYFVDESCETISTPYLVIEYIDGCLEFAPENIADCVRQLAEQLAAIHNADCSNVDLSFLHHQPDIHAKKFSKRPAKLDDSIGEERIRDILESVWPWPQRNKSLLIHGDFWPGNVLWKDGRIVGVIDWEDARVGDPVADLANSRLEILWAYGIDAMRSFTDHYQAVASIDLTYLSYWDLCAALKPAFSIAEWAAGWNSPPIGRQDVTEKTMREGHHLFVEQAMENLYACIGNG